MLQSFWYINNSIDFVSVFTPISLTEITSEMEHAHESLAPIPVKIYLFSFKDLEGRSAELELNLSKDTRDEGDVRKQVNKMNFGDQRGDPFLTEHNRPDDDLCLKP